MPVLERNSIINLTTLVISLALSVLIHPLFILLWLVVLIFDDIAYFAFQVSLFDPEIAIQRACQFWDIFLDGNSGEGRDLGFNYYNGDLTKSREQAQKDKWNFMIRQLDLKAGDTIIDVGCGYGDWLNYARSKGIQGMGINLSPDQAKYAREHYGLEIFNVNWKDILLDPDLQHHLYGKFDAVTFMDSPEHFVPAMYRDNEEKIAEIYSGMFELTTKLLRPGSDSSRVFISCIHMIKLPQTIQDTLACYLQIRCYSGRYPWQDDGLTCYAANDFREVARFDQTEDYRLTSVLDSDHFGAPKINWDLRRAMAAIGLFFLDPHHVHKWLEIHTNAWMWHFGKDAFDPNYNNEHQKKQRYVTLWWLVLEAKSKQSALSGSLSESDAR